MKKLIIVIAVVGMLVGGNVVWAQGNTSSTGSPNTSSTGSPNTSSTGSPNTSSTGGTPTTTSTPTPSSNPASDKIMNPLKVDSIKGLIYLIVDIVVYVGTGFAILAIIFVGFKFIYAQGKPEEIKEAKMWFLYIIIGLAILISAKTITYIIQNTLVNSGVVNNSAFGK